MHFGPPKEVEEEIFMKVGPNYLLWIRCESRGKDRINNMDEGVKGVNVALLSHLPVWNISRHHN